MNPGITYIGDPREFAEDPQPSDFYVAALGDSGYDVQRLDFEGGVQAVKEDTGDKALYIIEVMMPLPTDVSPEVSQDTFLGLAAGPYLHRLLRAKNARVPILFMAMPCPSSAVILDTLESMDDNTIAGNAREIIPLDLVRLVNAILEK